MSETTRPAPAPDSARRSASWSSHAGVPAQLRVIPICRPRFGYRVCGTAHQAPPREVPR